ncbi:MAG: HAD family phosphatase [Gemmatimonadota bacterium]
MIAPIIGVAPGALRMIGFDLDGVLLEFHPERRLCYLAQLTGMAPETIHDAIWGSAFEREAEAGAYQTGTEYLKAFNNRLGYELSREQWIAGRRAAMSVRPDVLEFVRRLRDHVNLAILTNNGALLGEALPELAPEVCEVFGEACHTSSSFNARKPDPLVYHRLVQHHGVEPGSALFIDDDVRNVEGAISAGLQAIHYQGLAALHGALVALVPGLR